jgi:2-keto-4-pentenoate hydratase/2-oxohepta-3-ene-1,7-dioic acid hydratase in catechol pathway
MRFATVRVDARPTAVLVRPSGELVALESVGFDSLQSLIEAGAAGLARVAATLTEAGAGDRHVIGQIEDVREYLPPLPTTRRNLFCVGSNYRPHMAEGDRPQGEVPSVPIVFTKPYTSLSGHLSEVPLHPAATSKVDWEAEIVVVIGTPGINIAAESALEHVFGYALGNDVSSRDLQRSGGDSRSQWFKGKSLDGHAPMGPFVVTPDEVGTPPSVDVELRMNGTLQQKFHSADMLHSVSSIIAYLSKGMRLLPGDVIYTGTSSGVGLWHDPPIFLADGDIVEISSPQLGILSNRFVGRDGAVEGGE